MKLSDFDYYLPKHMIAQKPVVRRDKAKLLVLNLKKDSITHFKFYQIKEILRPGDTIVLNDTRVVKAKLSGYKTTGGKVELLILTPNISKQKKNIDNNSYECLIKGRVRPGINLVLDLGENTKRKMEVEIVKKIDGGRFIVRFNTDISMRTILDKYGKLPLPPYIKKDLETPERYQTVYSIKNGSVAAPTAGLHFTPELLQELKKSGINIAYITLHINYGTFNPVRNEDITQHDMESEYAVFTNENASIINEAKGSNNGRLIAVGTTTVRTLETVAIKSLPSDGNLKLLKSWEGWTNLFIYPGFNFKAGIDTLITNFHLPKSTLIMLVSAFAGRDKILESYKEAIKNNYRFYSLGDAMMIIK